MARILFMFGVLAMALVACKQGPPPRLHIYVATKEAKPGLHEAKYSAFPDLGYIAEKPDLTISQLEGVSFAPPPVIPGGKLEEKPPEDKTTLVLRLNKQDADALHELTTQHIGDRLLLLLNDEPLVAPEIKNPSIGESVYIRPPPASQTSVIKEKLQPLVRK